MSCGGNCGCGSVCKCGGGCKMFPDVYFSEESSAGIIVAEVAPLAGHYEKVEMIGECESTEGCRCGSNCSCNPCRC